MNTQIFKTETGHPLPLGSTFEAHGINFSLISKEASAVTLILYSDKNKLLSEVPLNPEVNKTGDVWHIFIEIDPSKPLIYGYKIDGPIDQSLKHHGFDSTKVLLDPYAKAVVSSNHWGIHCTGHKTPYTPLSLAIPPSDYDWGGDQRPLIQDKDLIIYEMHVRGFTQHPSSHTQNPGSFKGVIEKIPHLVDLGINAVELLPIQEFNECEYQTTHSHFHKKLFQYWGYSTVNFFAPMNRYAASEELGAAIKEFKDMVKAFHKNGIKVILDVVFNHTNEGNENGPIVCFKGIDSYIYYMIDPEGKFMNYTGCGNTFNTNHPIVMQFIIDVLRYWVHEMHVDGFRFDLASIFYRAPNGEPLAYAPIVEAISNDPLLSNSILIAEPWDAAGLYQVGGFYPSKLRWSEWNARYRDTIRQFIKGTPSKKGEFASKLSGSQDIYSSRSTYSSVNFVISHDGFSLYDLVSYNQKHNFPNGENNKDGTSENDSWNCGVEGISHDHKILDLRERQIRNFHLALMISQGIPMLLMGDEYAHSKKGNNNTWCQDNELNWFLWNQLETRLPFYRFYKKMIAFRKEHPILHQGHFLNHENITWVGANGQEVNWDEDTQFLAFILFDKEKQKCLYCAFNAQNIPREIEIPSLENGQQWKLIVNTSNPSPEDFYEVGQEPLVEQKPFHMLPYSAILLTHDCA